MNQPATRPQPTTAPKGRMTLGNLNRGRIAQPMRVVLYGVEGVGKSTFGAAAPTAIFLGAEDGTSQLDVTRFPAPESWPEVLEAIRTLTADQHDFKTLVVDTLDWAEPLLWAHICQRDGKKDIEDYGYGKGYVAALDEWRLFLAALERLRAAKRMNVILLAHSWVKPFKNPLGEDFDRYEMKLHAKAAGLVKEWSDAVLFANYEVVASKDKATKRVRGKSTGARLIFTEHNAAWDAKNRYSLPPELPLDWFEFAAAVQSGQTAAPADLRAEVERRAAELGGADGKKALEFLGRAGDDAVKLAQLNNWVTSKLALRGETKEEQS